MKKDNVSEADIWAYVSKSADQETNKKVEEWKGSTDYDEALFHKITEVYKATGSNPYFDEKLNLEAAKKQFFESVETKDPKSIWINVLKYAAVLALLIITASYMYQTFLTTHEQVQILVQTTYGEHKQIDLSDGSVVWLNSSSKLTYDLESPRTLKLAGEAFFEVSKDKEHPFTVETPDQIIVKALGTSFNVKSYLESSFTETVLLTGKVEVTSGNKTAEKIIMLPNDKISIAKSDGQIIKSKLENADNSIAWKEGIIKFNNKSFKEIASDLSIQYNVKILFENEEISNSKFTGSFNQSTPINEILEILRTTKHFEFRHTKKDEWIIE